MEIVKYQEMYNDELNTWQEKENQRGENGLDKFVVPQGVLLGDYLKYVQEEMQEISLVVATHEKRVVGFLGYSMPEYDHVHVEIMGVNPDCRGKGLAQGLLTIFKDAVIEKMNIDKVTLAVKRENLSGIRAFSKIATRAEKLDTEYYLGFEL